MKTMQKCDKGAQTKECNKSPVISGVEDNIYTSSIINNTAFFVEQYNG